MLNGAKAFLATSVSIGVCYLTGVLTSFTDFTFAWVLNFVLMAWYTYLDSLFKWKYNSAYFNTLQFENNGRIYRFFGVHLYRKLLVWTGWEKISRKDLKIIKKEEALKRAEQGSRSSEAGHAIIFLIVMLVTFIVANTWREALWLIVLNVLLNLYPIIVQRYNRPRYKRLLRKFQEQSRMV